MGIVGILWPSTGIPDCVKGFDFGLDNCEVTDPEDAEGMLE